MSRKGTQFIISTVVLCAALAVAVDQAALAMELLTNPGWESGAPDQLLQATPVVAYGWTHQRTLSSSSINLRPENKFANQMIRSGTNAFRTSTNAATGTRVAWIIYQDVPAMPGGSYTASVWILARDISGNNTGFDSYPTDSVALWVQELDASNGLVVDHGKLAVTAANTSYEQRSTSFVAASTTAKIRFLLEVDVSERYDKTIITFDDCSLDGPPAVFNVTGTVMSGGSPIDAADVTCTTTTRTP